MANGGGTSFKSSDLSPTSLTRDCDEERDAKKATDACREALRRPSLPQLLGETSLKPGPVGQRTTDGGLKGVTNGTVKLRCGYLDITWGTCLENLGRARHERKEGSLELCDARVQHCTQGSLHCLHPGMKDLFTEVGGPSWAI